MPVLALLLVAFLAGCSDPPPPVDLSALDQTWVPASPRLVDGWDLRDGRGDPVTELDLLGRWTVVFVGYTSCPDVCPRSMAALAGAMPHLDPAPQVLFLAVDPERDTARLADWPTFFHPSFRGVTGAREAIDRAVEQLGASYRFRTEGDLVLVDHATSLFVVDPTGNVVGTVLRPSDPERLAADLQEAMAVSPRLTLVDPWIPPAPPGTPMAAYGDVVIHGAPTRLGGISSPAFGHAHVHGTVEEAGVARMVAASPALSPEAPLALRPGGLHLMLMAPSGDLSPGDRVPLTLTTEDGHRGRFLVPVRSR